MKKTKDGLRAHQLELICASDSKIKGQFADDNLYVLDGYSGLWRRITATRAKESPPPGIVAGWFDGGIVHLVPAALELHQELDQAYMTFTLPYHPAFLSLYKGSPIPPTMGIDPSDDEWDDADHEGAHREARPDAAEPNAPVETPPSESRMTDAPLTNGDSKTDHSAVPDNF